MADSGDVNVKIKLGADVSGGVQSRAEMQKLRAEAKRTATDTASGFTKLKDGALGVSRAIGFINKAIMGFGIIGLLTPIINLFKSWHEEAKKTEEAARNLRKEMEMKSAAAQVKEIAAAYKELTDAINETKEARQRDQEVFDEEVRVRREAEDAEMAADLADALAAVDPNAEDADKQKQRINERFDAKKKRLAADRKKEDVVLRRQKLDGEAEDATNAADKLEGTLAADDKAILRARTRASTLEALSKMKNDKDGTWWSPNKKTEEGNAVREQQRKEAEQAREEVKRLEADKKSKEKQIKDLRDSAAHSRKIRDVIGRSIDTAELERENVNVEEDTTIAANKAADKKEADKKAKEQAKVDDAKRAVELLQAEKSRIEAQIADRQSDKDAMGKYVADADGDYKTAKLGNNRKAQKSAYANLHKLQETAQNVNHEADSAINALTEALNNVNARLKAAQSAIKQASKQQQYAWNESPAGD